MLHLYLDHLGPGYSVQGRSIGPGWPMERGPKGFISRDQGNPDPLRERVCIRDQYILWPGAPHPRCYATDSVKY